MGREASAQRNAHGGEHDPCSELPTQTGPQVEQCAEASDNQGRVKTSPVCSSKKAIRPGMEHRRARSVQEAPPPDLLDVPWPGTENEQEPGSGGNGNQEPKHR